MIPILETSFLKIILFGNLFKMLHIYDHNYWGGAIMQKQPAIQMVKENGFDVFTVGKNE
jgi:hypothetical protein